MVRYYGLGVACLSPVQVLMKFQELKCEGFVKKFDTLQVGYFVFYSEPIRGAARNCRYLAI